MLIMKKSQFTGKTNQMEIPLPEEAFTLGMRLWEGGELIQNAFPTLK